MAFLKTKHDIAQMCITGKKLNTVFSQINFTDLIGLSTLALDDKIKDMLDKEGLRSCAKGYKGYPRYTCISINDVLVHGVPQHDVLIKSDDFIKIDICVSYNGYCADACRSYMNADPSDIFQKMVQCGKLALHEGINHVACGNTIGTVALAIEEVITRCGYSVVKEFAGHGIGKKMHEDPIVPNYFDKDDISTMKQKIYVGMALAIEPMFCQFDNDLVIDKKDEWTVRTRDGGIAMHVEDTVLLTDNGVIITTQL